MDIAKGIRTRKGAKINLKGDAEKIFSEIQPASAYALKPEDFFSLAPKLLVKEGEAVKKGQAVFFNKANDRVKFVSPVSGTLQEIVRGPKRKILAIRILADDKKQTVTHKLTALDKASREEVVAALLESGCWPFIQQRPYGIIANPDDQPKAIFVSTVSTAPLGVDYSFILENRKEDFQKGIDVLNKLAAEKVFVGVDKDFSGIFGEIKNMNSYTVDGPHPAGNVSLHIQHLAPLNMGERVWTVRPEDVANIGSFYASGIFSAQRTIAIAGSAVKSPKYFRTTIGAEIAPYLENAQLDTTQPTRVINGDVFTGVADHSKGYLGYFNNLVSVIPEGNNFRLFGWLPFMDNKIPSLSNTSLSRLFNRKGYEVTTNLNGEERALVVTGEMEKVFPFDIFPMQLLKACMIEDIEKMELLGIYEVVPEDFGLIDYANTSKVEAQEIIRKGIELMIKEVG